MSINRPFQCEIVAPYTTTTICAAPGTRPSCLRDIDACDDPAAGSEMRRPAHRIEAEGFCLSECPARTAARWMMVQMPDTGSSITMGVSDRPSTSSFSGVTLCGDGGATGMTTGGVMGLPSCTVDDCDRPERDDDGARGGSGPWPAALLLASPPLAATPTRSRLGLGCGWACGGGCSRRKSADIVRAPSPGVALVDADAGRGA